jgi:predicted DNA-binding transcriptional regulator YafY
MHTFTDKFGDDLEVKGYPDPDIVELSAADGETTAFNFTRDDAVDLAQAILEEAGASDNRPVSAKEITYNEGAMRLAAVNNKTVEFRYVKNERSAPESRRLVPSSVKGSGADLRFTGYDTDRGETRSFRLDRIRGDVRVVVA